MRNDYTLTELAAGRSPKSRGQIVRLTRSSDIPVGPCRRPEISLRMLALMSQPAAVRSWGEATRGSVRKTSLVYRRSHREADLKYSGGDPR